MQEAEKFKLKITVDEQPVRLNKFVKQIITNVVYALITSLKLDSPPKNIEIKLNNET